MTEFEQLTNEARLLFILVQLYGFGWFAFREWCETTGRKRDDQTFADARQDVRAFFDDCHAQRHETLAKYKRNNAKGRL